MKIKREKKGEPFYCYVGRWAGVKENIQNILLKSGLLQQKSQCGEFTVEDRLSLALNPAQTNRNS